jgi:hypothetical protein
MQYLVGELIQFPLLEVALIYFLFETTFQRPDTPLFFSAWALVRFNGRTRPYFFCMGTCILFVQMPLCMDTFLSIRTCNSSTVCSIT